VDTTWYCGFLSSILPREEMCTTFWTALFVIKRPLFLLVFIYCRYVGRTSRQQEILLFTVINCILCQMNRRCIWAKAQYFVLFLYIYCRVPRALEITTLFTDCRICHAFVLLWGDAFPVQFQLESRSLIQVYRHFSVLFIGRRISVIIRSGKYTACLHKIYKT
jgi:hypothetical protein